MYLSPLLEQKVQDKKPVHKIDLDQIRPGKRDMSGQLSKRFLYLIYKYFMSQDF
jgi:hypothetical protein